MPQILVIGERYSVFGWLVRSGLSVVAPGIQFPAIPFCRPSRPGIPNRNGWFSVLFGRWRRGQVFIKEPGFLVRTPALAKCNDLQDQYSALKGNGQDIAGFNGFACGRNFVLVDPDMPACCQFLRKGSRFRDPGVPKPLIDAQICKSSWFCRRY